MMNLVTEACEIAIANGKVSALSRGSATIPLPGIDVPFHSRYLVGGVEPFRHLLRQACSKEALRAATLEGHYIPNLTGKVFEVTREYTEFTYSLTQSPYLKSLLADWDALKVS